MLLFFNIVYFKFESWVITTSWNTDANESLKIIIQPMISFSELLHNIKIIHHIQVLITNEHS